MGSIVTNPPSVPNTEVDSWAPLVVRDAMSYYGLNKVTLTNWDGTTTVPQIAQGSLIDIDGSLAQFISDEAIGGAPSDGTVYIYFAVVGDAVTPTLTNTAPEWYADKGGWYNALGERYSGHVMTKAGTSYSNKRRLTDCSQGTLSLNPNTNDINGLLTTDGITSSGGVNTNNTYIKHKKFSGSLNSSGDATISHGITYSKILSISTALAPTALTAYDVWRDGDPSQSQYDTVVSFNSTSILIDAGINIYANGAYRCVVFYEA